MQCCTQIFYLRFAFFSFNTKLFFFSPVSWSAILVFLNHHIFWVPNFPRACQSGKVCCAILSNHKTVESRFLSTEKAQSLGHRAACQNILKQPKIARDALLKLLSNHRLKTAKRKRRTQTFEN